MTFQDRVEAGMALGARLRQFFTGDAVLVLALPRGGVPVGFEVARALGAPLDIFLVRKLGVPDQEELAMGAIASGGTRLLDEEVIQGLGISPVQLEETTRREERELARRERLYRRTGSGPDISGQTIVLVDDGIATGWTMSAAIEALRNEGAREIVVAVPVAAAETCKELERSADAVVCLYTPPQFFAVGQWYRDFSQTTDEEVRDLLARSRRAHGMVA